MAIIPKNQAKLFPKVGKISMLIFAVLFLIVGFRAYTLFGYIFKPNVAKSAIILIPSGADYKAVETIVLQKNILTEPKAFRWVSKKKAYKTSVKPGRYGIKKGWNTNQLVNLLRSGEQTPMKVTFNNVRFFDELAGKIDRYFEADSVQFLAVLSNDSLIVNYHFRPETFSAMFVPNTYQLYWTTTPTEFVERMNREYLKFWNESRLEKAKTLGLTPVEVTTLASIVQEETIKEAEKAIVAGLYLNRLKRGMLLQADPTIKYAIHDFTVRRITNLMLEVDSPYNTYRYKGLPPGPINFPEITSIDAVLNAKNHSYLYMCAKEDFSGSHNFSTNLTQHNIYAARYRKALNQNKIYK